MQYLYNKLLINFTFYFNKGASQNVDFHAEADTGFKDYECHLTFKRRID